MRTYFQTAWVVADLEAAIRRWVEATSIGPFYVMPHVQLDEAVYRGKPADLDWSVALAQVGSTVIELIEQHDDSPSAFRDSVPAGTDAMHHVGAYTDDFDADLAYYEGIGVDLAFTGALGDMRFGFFDTRAAIGCMTELIQRTEAMEGLFAMIAEAGASWDGTDPIRSLS